MTIFAFFVVIQLLIKTMLVFPTKNNNTKTYQHVLGDSTTIDQPTDTPTPDQTQSSTDQTNQQSDASTQQAPFDQSFSSTQQSTDQSQTTNQSDILPVPTLSPDAEAGLTLTPTLPQDGSPSPDVTTNPQISISH